MTNRAAWHWALYDWANSAFALSVMAGFFPIFLKQYWSAGGGGLSTFRLGSANALAALAIAVLAPALGAIADRRGAGKTFLGGFAFVGIGATAGLYFVGRGGWPVAIALYIVASIGFVGGNVFYNAMLLDVAPRDRWDVVSARGFALGYLGGGLLFALNVAMVLEPALFGLADSTAAVRVAFLTVAAWWALFALPLFAFVPQRRTAVIPWARAAADGLAQLRSTLGAIRRLRPVWVFLLAYWLYIDGVNTVVEMAVDYGLGRGLNANDLIVALLLTQFVSFPAAIAFGRLGARFGPRRGIALAIAVYTAATVWALFLRTAADFYALAVVIGLVQGGIQSLSRSYYARLIPAAQATEFFGFFGIVGKSAAVIGPFAMGAMSLLTHNAQLSILIVIALLAAGAMLLALVPATAPARSAVQTQV